MLVNSDAGCYLATSVVEWRPFFAHRSTFACGRRRREIVVPADAFRGRMADCLSAEIQLPPACSPTSRGASGQCLLGRILFIAAAAAGVTEKIVFFVAPRGDDPPQGQNARRPVVVPAAGNGRALPGRSDRSGFIPQDPILLALAQPEFLLGLPVVRAAQAVLGPNRITEFLIRHGQDIQIRGVQPVAGLGQSVLEPGNGLWNPIIAIESQADRVGDVAVMFDLERSDLLCQQQGNRGMAQRDIWAHHGPRRHVQGKRVVSRPVQKLDPVGGGLIRIAKLGVALGTQPKREAGEDLIRFDHAGTVRDGSVVSSQAKLPFGAGGEARHRRCAAAPNWHPQSPRQTLAARPAHTPAIVAA